MDCGPLPESGPWRCQLCGFRYHKPARRNCPASFPPEIKEARKAACEGCEWLCAGRCLAQVKANCPKQTAPRVDEIAGHLGAVCPEGRWPA